MKTDHPSRQALIFLAPPSGISSKDWGEQNRKLSVLTSASAGRWTMDMIPFFVPVLDSLDDDEIEVVVLQKSTQIAGTETFLTWLGKSADQDPGPAMMCFSDEDTAEEVVDRRLRPMIRSSSCLARHVVDAKFNLKSIQLLNNFSLTPAWASSISKTASRPIRYLYLSEITKPGYGKSGEEGSVLSRIFQRTESFPNKKIAIETTPTIEGDNIDKQMSLCQVIYDWHVPCPDCGALQALVFFPDKDGNGGVTFPKDGTTQERAAQARYQCKACKSLWTTAQKNEAVSRGVSVPRGPVPANVKRVGFHISRLYSFFPGGRLEALAEAFLLAAKDVNELQSFYNNSLALHWKMVLSKPPEESFSLVMGCKTDHERLIIPEDAVALIATVDTQQAGFWFRLRAWRQDGESWGIQEGSCVSFDDLDQIIFKTHYKVENGHTMRVWRCLIDIGGTKEAGKEISRTEEVYEWIRQNDGFEGVKIFGAKGSSRSMATRVNVGRPLDQLPSGRKFPAGMGLQIIEINTLALKESLWARITRTNEGQPGGWHLHKDTPDWYAKQIIAEEKRIAKDGSVEWVKVHPDNHMLDLEIMQIAAADNELWGGVSMLRSPKKPEKEPEKGPELEPDKAKEPPKKKEKKENPWNKGAFG